MKIHGNFYISWHQNYKHVRASFFSGEGQSLLFQLFSTMTHVNILYFMLKVFVELLKQ